MVPTDFSACARQALDYAIGFAEQVGATVTLLHIYQVPSLMLPDGSTFVAPPQEMTKLGDAVDRHLAELSDEVADRGVQIKTASVLGAPAHEIVHYASERGFDLVVMGTHGRTGLGHLILGSVAEHVVRASTVPVLTVRATHDRPAAHTR